ncbi:hypothetical protein Xths_01495 [Xanthomonas campestris pv. thespesiae]|nr:hypothetical protein Xths_01495 [Xanthomonas campestris pv. thespesiae]
MSSSGAPRTTCARAPKSPSLTRCAAKATCENCRDSGRDASRPQNRMTGTEMVIMAPSIHQSGLASPGRKFSMS